MSLCPGNLSAENVDTTKGKLHCLVVTPKKKRSLYNLLETMTKRLDPDVKATNKIKFGKIRSERVKGVGNPFFGKHHTAEANEKNRNTHIGKPSSRKGATHTPEAKDKLRKSRIGKPKVTRVISTSTDPKVKLIPLTKGYVAIIDSEDYNRLSKFLWITHKDKKRTYAQRALPKENGKQRGETMPHAIMGKPPKGLMIDHINGNGLDNRKCNLRFVTNRQNCMNRHQAKSSKYPGVTWDKRARKWTAQAQINGKHVHIGTYKSEELAYAAYQNLVVPIEESLIGEIV